LDKAIKENTYTVHLNLYIASIILLCL